MAEPSVASEKARIKRILASGANSITVDGITTSINHTELRRRLKELEAIDPDTGKQRPIIQGVFLGGW